MLGDLFPHPSVVNLTCPRFGEYFHSSLLDIRCVSSGLVEPVPFVHREALMITISNISHFFQFDSCDRYHNGRIWGTGSEIFP